jgi:hypothetical protein
MKRLRKEGEITQRRSCRTPAAGSNAALQVHDFANRAMNFTPYVNLRSRQVVRTLAVGMLRNNNLFIIIIRSRLLVYNRVAIIIF